jgi:hypothetical protein
MGAYQAHTDAITMELREQLYMQLYMKRIIKCILPPSQKECHSRNLVQIINEMK